MTRVARRIAWEDRKKSRVILDGREVSGVFMNTASTASVLDRVRALWPIARSALETDYVWIVYHNDSERCFLTSDSPCQLDSQTQKVTMPLALDLAIIGEVVADNETPRLRHADATREVIRQINQGVVKNCRSLVYSHKQSGDLRRFVMKHHVFNPDPLSAGRGFVNDPKPMTPQDMQRLMDRFNEIRRRERERAQSGDSRPPG
jgi:hypothetical protein